MTEPHNADRLDRVRMSRPGGETDATPHCLDDDTIAALAEGSLTGEGRLAGLTHLAGCGRCRSAVVSVARALADPGVARELRAAEGARRPRILRVGAVALVAAAAGIILFAWPPRTEEPAPHRAPAITASPAPTAVWPVGAVAEARTLRWTPVAGADRYRVSLFNADGFVLYEADLTDTVLALPDSVRPVAGGTYWWQVDARLGFDRWAASALIEFSVVPGQSP